jgi:hypothetical protein
MPPDMDSPLSKFDGTLSHYLCACYHSEVYISELGTVETSRTLARSASSTAIPVITHH